MGFKVTILHVVPEPEEDYFPTSTEIEKWFAQYEQKVDVMLKDYRQMLITKGFAPENVTVRSTVRYCPSMAKCILPERDDTLYSTIVLGR